MNDLREILEIWPLLAGEQRAEAAQRLRPGMVAMAVQNLGARDQDEVRDALELVVAGCQAELDADKPSPMPQPLNRAQRRARRAA